jgi:integrase
MADIPLGSYVNSDNDRTITMDEYALLLDACLKQEWRTIIALARIGGLRCPSELKRLKWDDIDWTGNRFTVRPPKTERYEQHSKRVVPLFAELRSELQKHFDASAGNEFVIQGYHGKSWKLHDAFQRIAHRAGLGEVIRPFDNMRTSRSNEVLRKFGAVKESLWIGHSTKTMEKHYLKLEDEDFSEAAGE